MSVAVFTSYGQQLDNSGAPLNGGSVTVQQAGTTTSITLKSASDLSGSAAANPIVLDSAGRHDMRYFATQAYKVIVKNSSGTTIYTRDNIDPGIAIGTGDLAISDGGTGASTAPAALTNLGGATAASVADVAAQVAAVTGALGSTAKTHIATGTTGQRDAVPAAGDIRRNTTTGFFEGYNDSAAWVNFIASDFTTGHSEDSSPDPANDFLLEGDSSAGTTKKLRLTNLATALNATQAQVEAGIATTALVSPAMLVYGVGSAKMWANMTGNGAGTLNSPSHNMTSTTRNGTGDFSFTIATDFSTAVYSISALGRPVSGGGEDDADMMIDKSNALTGGVARLSSVDSTTGSKIDPALVTVMCFGDV